MEKGNYIGKVLSTIGCDPKDPHPTLSQTLLCLAAHRYELLETHIY